MSILVIHIKHSDVQYKEYNVPVPPYIPCNYQINHFSTYGSYECCYDSPTYFTDSELIEIFKSYYEAIKTSDLIMIYDYIAIDVMQNIIYRLDFDLLLKIDHILAYDSKIIISINNFTKLNINCKSLDTTIQEIYSYYNEPHIYNANTLYNVIIKIFPNLTNIILN